MAGKNTAAFGIYPSVEALQSAVDTPYVNEIARRLMIQIGRQVNFLSDQTERPQFQRPHPQAGKLSAPLPLPPPPEGMHDPLPPRPPSQ